MLKSKYAEIQFHIPQSNLGRPDLAGYKNMTWTSAGAGAGYNIWCNSINNIQQVTVLTFLSIKNVLHYQELFKHEITTN